MAFFVVPMAGPARPSGPLLGPPRPHARCFWGETARCRPSCPVRLVNAHVHRNPVISSSPRAAGRGHRAGRKQALPPAVSGAGSGENSKFVLDFPQQGFRKDSSPLNSRQNSKTFAAALPGPASLPRGTGLGSSPCRQRPRVSL